MPSKVISPLSNVQTIAIGSAIREIDRLKKTYGDKLWRKRKGFARIELANGSTFRAKLHWYEAHGAGKKEMKIKKD